MNFFCFSPKNLQLKNRANKFSFTRKTSNTCSFARKNVRKILLAIVCCTTFFSCTPKTQSKSEVVMGTICTIKLFDDGTTKLYDKIFSRLREIDNAFSTTIETSEISKINEAAGIHAVAASRDVLFVVEAALYFARISRGAFDPTIGPLVKLWAINTEGAYIPSDEEIAKVLPLVNWRNVQIVKNENANETAQGSNITIHSNSENASENSQNASDKNANAKTAGTIMLLQKGMSLDLGGIAKGFAADEIVRLLREAKVRKAIIDLGGNVFVFGKKASNELWHVGIKNPNDATGEPIAILHTSETSVVTSGVYERFFIADGIRYHHILNPKTGKPARTNLLSTTIVCKSSLASDALSTTIFVLGKTQGDALLKKLSAEQNSFVQFSPIENFASPLASIFIDEDETLFASRSLEGNIEVGLNEIIFE